MQFSAVHNIFMRNKEKDFLSYKANFIIFYINLNKLLSTIMKKKKVKYNLFVILKIRQVSLQ